MIEQALAKKGLMPRLGKPDAELRCQKCGKLFFRGKIIFVEIKCPRCGHLQELEQ